MSTILGNESAGESDRVHRNLWNTTRLFGWISRLGVTTSLRREAIGKVKRRFLLYILQVSSRPQEVRLDTLLYLISRQAGDDKDKVKAYISALKEMWQMLEDLDSLKVANNYYSKVAEHTARLSNAQRPLPRSAALFAESAV